MKKPKSGDNKISQWDMWAEKNLVRDQLGTDNKSEMINIKRIGSSTVIVDLQQW